MNPRFRLAFGLKHGVCALALTSSQTPLIALAIHLNARLWTEDNELKKGLRAKEFNLFFEP